MIITDQPTCFPKKLLVKLSSKADGTVLDRAVGVHDGTIVSNRTKFCDKIGINYGDVVFQRIIYNQQRSYELIAETDDASTTKNTSEVVADALFTRHKNVALMLPVADCVATIVYDPRLEMLALLHMGRHSTLTSLIPRTIDKFLLEGADTQDLIVWMSPNAHQSHYVMEYFDSAGDSEWQDFCYKNDSGYHLDLQGYNKAAFLKKGLKTENVHTSGINTVTSENYFSHSAGDKTGRFAVVAMMR